MKRKSIAVLALCLIFVTVAAAFALTACNKEIPEDIKDHSNLFFYKANDDNASYSAYFQPPKDLIIPEKLYVPAQYSGFPVTYAAISRNFTSEANLNKIKYVYMPECVKGGSIEIATPFTYNIRNKSVKLVEFMYPYESRYDIMTDGEHYDSWRYCVMSKFSQPNPECNRARSTQNYLYPANFIFIRHEKSAE